MAILVVQYATLLIKAVACALKGQVKEEKIEVVKAMMTHRLRDSWIYHLKAKKMTIAAH